jgi:hypothetical protein
VTSVDTNFKKNLFKIRKEVFSYELKEVEKEDAKEGEKKIEQKVQQINENVMHGTIGMSFTLMDLRALRDLDRSLGQGRDLTEDDLPHQSILSMYQGHTIFSLFYD